MRRAIAFSFLLFCSTVQAGVLDAVLAGKSPNVIELSNKELVLYVAKKNVHKGANEVLRKYKSNIYIKKIDLEIKQFEERQLPDGYSQAITALAEGFFTDSKGRKFRAYIFVTILKKATLLSNFLVSDVKVWKDDILCFDDWFPEKSWTGKCQRKDIEKINGYWKNRETDYQVMSNSM